VKWRIERLLERVFSKMKREDGEEKDLSLILAQKIEKRKIILAIEVLILKIFTTFVFTHKL
jgi:hypothetical protein